EHNELKKSLQSYRTLWIQDWLYAVISGTAHDSGVEFQPAIELQEKWEREHHIVFVVEVIHNERIQGITVTDWNLFKFAVSNIIQELLSKHWPQSHFLQLYGYHFAVILHVDEH